MRLFWHLILRECRMVPKKTPKKISPELRDKLDKQDWPNIFSRLTLYAAKLLAGNPLNNKHDIERIISDSITKVFTGQLTWDFEIFPDVYIVLAGNVRSSIGHEFKKKKIPFQNIEEYHKIINAEESNPYYSFLNIHDEKLAKRFKDYIYDYFKDEKEILKVLILIEDGKKRREISESLGINKYEYDKRLKIIKYASKKFNK